MNLNTFDCLCSYTSSIGSGPTLAEILVVGGLKLIVGVLGLLVVTFQSIVLLHFSGAGTNFYLTPSMTLENDEFMEFDFGPSMNF